MSPKSGDTIIRASLFYALSEHLPKNFDFFFMVGQLLFYLFFFFKLKSHTFAMWQK